MIAEKKYVWLVRINDLDQRLMFQSVADILKALPRYIHCQRIEIERVELS